MKKKIAIILILACALTTFGLDEPIDVSAKTKIGKVKDFTFEYTSEDGLRLNWSKYKKADGYQIYRDGSKIKTIKAKKSKKAYTYKDKKFDIKKNDKYLVKAYKIVKKKCKKVKKVIAKSQTISFQKEYYGAGGQNDYYIEFIPHEEGQLIKATYPGGGYYSLRRNMELKIDNKYLSSYKRVALYGRAIVDLDQSGYILGPWELVWDNTQISPTGSRTIVIPAKYIALGFEYDTKFGPSYPYSGVFLNYEGHDIINEHFPNYIKNIRIETAGLKDDFSIKIYIDEKKVFQDENCSSHEPYPFEIF